MNPIERRRIFDVIKRATGLPLGALNETVRRGGELEPDHLQLAQQVLAAAGPENVLMAGVFVWTWHQSGVWQKQEDRAFKQLVQNLSLIHI